ncbi:trans-1,2-dihydrobenzene-1,2-diol dehydrogenase-like [Octopus sinensis]|uniref:Trans-1,2-dihydrobenzene-1,2-diol dehydrogenase n=1 Tax=Octopus sinensis TaxID=2607531 RepID=A0A6P7T1D6_9MOLL|nr:trans-1,2-dihydrobenzene-1,2-diol dehydrogenase-like [Octopus sinensis]
MRWGIYGTGCIAEDFCKALGCMDQSLHEIVAVGCDDSKAASEFGKKFKIPNTYGCCEEFVRNKNIDVVYVSSPVGDRYEDCYLMIQYNKHVLCEAPCALRAEECFSLIEFARRNKVFFMEGIWMCFLPIFRHIKEEIDQGTIGDVKYFDAALFFDVLHKEKRSTTGISGGCISNIGVYLLWLVQFVFRENPEHVLTIGNFTSNGIDEACNIILLYQNGSKASLSCHSKLKGRADAWIYGTNGSIYIHPPLWSTNKITINSVETEIPLGLANPSTDVEFNYPESMGFICQAELVRHWIRAGFTESPLHTLTQTQAVSRLLETVREKLYRSRNDFSTVPVEEQLSFFEKMRCTII